MLLESHSLIDAVNAQDYDRGGGFISRLFHRILSFLVLDLLQSGIDPCTVDKYRRTALHVASTKVNAAIGRFSNRRKKAHFPRCSQSPY